MRGSDSLRSTHGVTASVVVPVYNGARYLPRLIDSLRAQTFDDFEVVAIDDGSTDESFELLSRFADDEPRLRVHRTPRNLGSAPRAVNSVLPLVTGVHFLYASQDDFFSPDWLECMITRSQMTGADAVVPDMVYFSGSGDDRALIGLDGDRDVILDNRGAVEASLSWRIPGCALWRTEDVRRVGWSDTTFDGDELSVRRLYHAASTVAFSEGTYFYNQANADAITKVRHPRQLQSIYTALNLRDFLRDHEYDPDLYSSYISRAATAFFRAAVEVRRSRLTVDPATAALVEGALERLSSTEVRRDLRVSATGRGRLASLAVSHGSTFFGASTRLAAMLPTT